MTNEERGELERLARKVVEMGPPTDSAGRHTCCEPTGTMGLEHTPDCSWGQLDATLDRLTDEQSGAMSEERAAELAEAIMSEAHESTTHPGRREIEMEPIRLHEGDLLLLDDVEYEVTAAVHGRTLDRVTLRRKDRNPEPPDSTEPEDDVVERVARWLERYDRPGPIRVGTYHDRARRLLHDTGILTTESETP